MGKSTSVQRVQKVNFAFSMLQAGRQRGSVTEALVSKFGLSQRQAFRYLKQAENMGMSLPIPEEKTVFTVKLSLNLTHAIRVRAKEQGQSISQWVSEALEFVLKNGKQQEQITSGK